MVIKRTQVWFPAPTWWLPRDMTSSDAIQACRQDTHIQIKQKMSKYVIELKSEVAVSAGGLP